MAEAAVDVSGIPRILAASSMLFIAVLSFRMSERERDLRREHKRTDPAN